MSIEDLTRLTNREYGAVVKNRIRDDELWKELEDDALIERTRLCLDSLIASIDEQKERVGTEDVHWNNRINRLRGYATGRLHRLPVRDAPIISGTREAKAWRNFAALLAAALRDGDPLALDNLKAPFGGMTASQWLVAREHKDTNR